MKALLCVILAAAVGGCRNTSLAPEPIPVDQVHCARCGMLISISQGGGEIVSPDAETRFYDDLACLAAHAREAAAGARTFVRLGAESFVEADKAYYAESDAVRTPMGSGLLAAATAEAARRADREGRARRWTDLLGRVEE